MTVGILIITHGEIGTQIVKAACETLGSCPLPIQVVSISNSHQDLETIQQQAEQTFEALEQGDGVLILTDLYGSTPSNIASALLTGHNAQMLSGLNLPMLIRIMNYPNLALDELAKKALSGARDGTILSNSWLLM